MRTHKPHAMHINFGLHFDDRVLTARDEHLEAEIFDVGPYQLLQLLETHLGLAGHPTDQEAIRIEQYRQALLQYEPLHGRAFYYASFEADAFGTSADLLSRRDELCYAAWDFDAADDAPERLQVLARVERLLPADFCAGRADRYVAVLKALPERDIPITSLYCFEPEQLLPQAQRRLLEALDHKGVSILYAVPPAPTGDTDLGRWQSQITAARTTRQSLRADGTLLLLHAASDTEAAAFMAKLINLNDDYCPDCLIPDHNRALDMAFRYEGVPCMGIETASVGRPSLQLLKLVTAFVWKPVNPYKIMEFLSLNVKPIDDGLAERLAQLLAARPGLFGEGWGAVVQRYLDEVRTRGGDAEAIEKQYNFWFDRPRYAQDDRVPKLDAVRIFEYLHRWALQRFDEEGQQSTSLLVLSEQARRITELLDTLPEDELDQLELERVVRTIYKPSPVQLDEGEVGHTHFAYHPGAVASTPDHLLWWNFSQRDPDFFFSRWYVSELSWLTERGILLESPDHQNERLLWHRSRPVMHARKQLLLVYCERVDGTDTGHHPLHSDLEATFGDLSAITFKLSSADDMDRLSEHFDVPGIAELPCRHYAPTPDMLDVQIPQDLNEREYETLTSLDDLLYYPYKWAFQYKLKLRPSSILDIVDDNRLKGNLAHRLFELLLSQPDVLTWDRRQIETYIDQRAAQLLEREGSTLLLYGRQPDRVSLLRAIERSAVTLVGLIRDNGWRIFAIEQDLEGQFDAIPMKARADLVLQRGEQEYAILDLKWRGSSRNKDKLTNGLDLQLVLYAQLFGTAEATIHTAYYIISDSQLLARNTRAFREAVTAGEPEHAVAHRHIYDRMVHTHQWRRTQFADRQLEIRTSDTAPTLDAHYSQTLSTEQMLRLLEMKMDDAPFDSYGTLLRP